MREVSINFGAGVRPTQQAVKQVRSTLERCEDAFEKLTPYPGQDVTVRSGYYRMTSGDTSEAVRIHGQLQDVYPAPAALHEASLEFRTDSGQEFHCDHGRVRAQGLEFVVEPNGTITVLDYEGGR